MFESSRPPQNRVTQVAAQTRSVSLFHLRLQWAKSRRLLAYDFVYLAFFHTGNPLTPLTPMAPLRHVSANWQSVGNDLAQEYLPSSCPLRKVYPQRHPPAVGFTVIHSSNSVHNFCIHDNDHLWQPLGGANSAHHGPAIAHCMLRNTRNTVCEDRTETLRPSLELNATNSGHLLRHSLTSKCTPDLNMDSITNV